MDIHQIRHANAINLIEQKKRQKDSAEAWGVSDSYIAQIKGGKIIGDVLARRIEVAEGKERGWMDHDHSDNNPFLPIKIADDESGEDYAFIPMLSAKAAAGAGCDNENVIEKSSYAFGREWMRQNHLKEENLQLITACGQSMEPNIQDGDALLIDLSQTDVCTNRVYAIRRPDHSISVKRLIQRFSGKWWIISDNDKVEDEEIGDLSAFHSPIIGRVVWRGGMM
ncbi:S24 family peptidase [Carnimonas bestiolae]|uniref:S24 family peptidase n=1 Tax=Carnimonas bestiolae TaxID=3402172 RepID=UPI003EDBE40D